MIVKIYVPNELYKYHKHIKIYRLNTENYNVDMKKKQQRKNT